MFFNIDNNEIQNTFNESNTLIFYFQPLSTTSFYYLETKILVICQQLAQLLIILFKIVGLYEH